MGEAPAEWLAKGTVKAQGTHEAGAEVTGPEPEQEGVGAAPPEVQGAGKERKVTETVPMVLD